eukprot:scaffold865_cov405-Pavlova_lutheri.AAC.2
MLPPTLLSSPTTLPFYPILLSYYSLLPSYYPPALSYYSPTTLSPAILSYYSLLVRTVPGPGSQGHPSRALPSAALPRERAWMDPASTSMDGWREGWVKNLHATVPYQRVKGQGKGRGNEELGAKHHGKRRTRGPGGECHSGGRQGMTGKLQSRSHPLLFGGKRAAEVGGDEELDEQDQVTEQ